MKLKCKFLIGHDASSPALVLFVVGAAVSLAPSPRSKKVQGLLRPFCVAAGRGSSRADHHTLRAGGSRRQQEAAGAADGRMEMCTFKKL